MANFDFSHVTLKRKKIDTGEKKKDLFECSKEEFFDRMIDEALKGKARCMDMYLSTKDEGWLDLAYSYGDKVKEWIVRRTLINGL